MDDVDELSQLWPTFGLKVTCGPLVMRALRDADFPEVLALVHAGIHEADRMPFNVPWTRRTGAEAIRALSLTHLLGVFDVAMLRVYAGIGAAPEVLGTEGGIGVGLWAEDAKARARLLRRAAIEAEALPSLLDAPALVPALAQAA